MRNATALPRYFGYGRGITFYTWTSDQYSQYGTKVISATVRDATYILDEILDNETDLTILEHTSDHAGYTDLVFALFDLLGMRFSPRLRDLGDAKLYRIRGGLINDFAHFPNLTGLFTGQVDIDRIARARLASLARADGKIRRKQEQAQTEQARCLNLVANAIVVRNTLYIQAVAYFDVEGVTPNSVPILQKA